jgi:hypothetical protein
MGDLSTMQSVKQGTRGLLNTMNDKVAIASATVGRGDTHVRAHNPPVPDFSVWSRIVTGQHSQQRG